MKRLEEIRRAHASARPNTSNPAWWNCHRDLSVALKAVDQAAEATREACCVKIRADCQACEGTGYLAHNPESGPSGPYDPDECEYCGRPIAAIRALKLPE